MKCLPAVAMPLTLCVILEDFTIEEIPEEEHKQTHSSKQTVFTKNMHVIGVLRSCRFKHVHTKQWITKQSNMYTHVNTHTPIHPSFPIVYVPARSTLYLVGQQLHSLDPGPLAAGFPLHLCFSPEGQPVL